MFHYELFTDKYGYFFEIEIIEKSKTQFQEMVVANSPVFGKLLILDNVIQIAERDERNYHEPIVHYPMAMHKKPKSILILGGGDGCLAREVLKHRGVKKVVMVDIDGGVVEASKKHFLEINQNPYADGRFRVVIDDAMKYVKETKDRFDVIFMDLVDPVGPGKNLYVDETIGTYKAVLNPGGVVISHAQSISPPHFAAEKLFVKMKGAFRHSHLYTNYMQSFGDLWGFAAFSDDLDFQDKKAVKKAKKKIAKMAEGGKELLVVNESFFDHAYYLPSWAKKKIGELEKIGGSNFDFTPTVISAGYREQMP